MGRSLPICAALALCLCVVNEAAAQNFERYRPRTVDPPAFTPNIPTEDVPDATGSEEILVDRLDAVIVWGEPAEIDPDNAFADASGIVNEVGDYDSLTHTPQFRAIVNSYIGGPITLRNLNQMSRDIIVLYRNSGQPVVDVVIPEQKITAGTVQLVVIETRIGQVRVEGACWTDPCCLYRHIWCTHEGERLYEWSLQEDLRRLNEYAWRRVEVDLEPGAVDGTTDVIFEVFDVMPVRAYAGYEDTGVQNLELERYIGGLIVGNPFGHEGTLSYQYTADGDFKRLEAHSAFYSVDLHDCWSFETYGSWAGVTPVVAIGASQNGESWQAACALTRKLIDTTYERASCSVGFDFKRTNTNVEFGGARVGASNADLVSIRLGYRHLWLFCCDEYLQFRNDTYIGPGPGFSSGNTTAAFNSVRLGTSPDFVYNRTNLERLWNLPNCWQFIARGTAQIASERLLFSEMLGFGGYDTIRGYDQRTLNGDNGWLVNLELGPQPWQCASECESRSLRMYSFVDIGRSDIIDPVPLELGDQSLVSAGVGCRYSISNRLSLRFDYGHGFSDVLAVQSSSANRAHLGIIGFLGPSP